MYEAKLNTRMDNSAENSSEWFVDFDVTDEASGLRMFRLRVPVTELVRSMWGNMGCVACGYEPVRVDMVGTVREVDHVSVVVNDGSFAKAEPVWRALEEDGQTRDDDGWIYRDDDLKNHHNWKRTSRDNEYTVSFGRRRYLRDGVPVPVSEYYAYRNKIAAEAQEGRGRI